MGAEPVSQVKGQPITGLVTMIHLQLNMQAKDFEDAGLPRVSAEKLAEQITELIVINRIKMEETFVTNAYMEKASTAS